MGNIAEKWMRNNFDDLFYDMINTGRGQEDSS